MSEFQQNLHALHSRPIFTTLIIIYLLFLCELQIFAVILQVQYFFLLFLGYASHQHNFDIGMRNKNAAKLGSLRMAKYTAMQHLLPVSV